MNLLKCIVSNNPFRLVNKVLTVGLYHMAPLCSLYHVHLLEGSLPNITCPFCLIKKKRLGRHRLWRIPRGSNSVSVHRVHFTRYLGHRCTGYNAQKTFKETLNTRHWLLIVNILTPYCNLLLIVSAWRNQSVTIRRFACIYT